MPSRHTIEMSGELLKIAMHRFTTVSGMLLALFCVWLWFTKEKNKMRRKNEDGESFKPNRNLTDPLHNAIAIKQNIKGRTTCLWKQSRTIVAVVRLHLCWESFPSICISTFARKLISFLFVVWMMMSLWLINPITNLKGCFAFDRLFGCAAASKLKRQNNRNFCCFFLGEFTVYCISIYLSIEWERRFAEHIKATNEEEAEKIVRKRVVCLT